jgi:small subunit ribosomal protein S6
MDTAINYEVTFIVRPDLADADYNTLVDKYTRLILDNGGEIKSQEIWGNKKMAYEIERFRTGYYVFTEYKAEPTFAKKLEREFNIDDNVIRYLNIKVEKHALAFNDKRRLRVKANTEFA